MCREHAFIFLSSNISVQKAFQLTFIVLKYVLFNTFYSPGVFFSVSNPCFAKNGLNWKTKATIFRSQNARVAAFPYFVLQYTASPTSQRGFAIYENLMGQFYVTGDSKRDKLFNYLVKSKLESNLNKK